MRDVAILLQSCDVSAVLEAQGIVFEKRRNKNGFELYFKCPTNNHTDDPDKLRISIADAGIHKGKFNCWSCGFSGNLIHLIRYLRGWDFKQTITYLESDYGSSELIGTKALMFRLSSNKPDNIIDSEIPEIDYPSSYKRIFDDNTQNAKAAVKWLMEERNIKKEMIDKFGIGTGVHQQIGFSIIVPIYFQKRLVSLFFAQPWSGGEKRYPKHAPHGRVLFNYDTCTTSKSYVMVESILDVIKIESITGIHSAACFTNMISDNQLKLLNNFDMHGVMPDLDGEAGWRLVDRMLPTVGKSLQIFFVPIGKDPGDCTPDELLFTVSHPMRYCDYESDQLIKRYQYDCSMVANLVKK